MRRNRPAMGTYICMRPTSIQWSQRVESTRCRLVSLSWVLLTSEKIIIMYCTMLYFVPYITVRRLVPNWQVIWEGIKNYHFGNRKFNTQLIPGQSIVWFAPLMNQCDTDYFTFVVLLIIYYFTQYIWRFERYSPEKSYKNANENCRATAVWQLSPVAKAIRP